MGYENLIYKCENKLAKLTLNRPDKLNALAGSMREDILDALGRFEADPAARVLVVTGAGEGFCTGGDVHHMAELMERDDAEAFRRLVELGGQVVQKLRSLPKPVIASINGPAAGAGLNLALACDLRIASERATFSQSFVRVGLHPDWGGTYLLARQIGVGRAMELVLTGKVIEAQQAMRMSLISKVVAHQELEPETRKWAEMLADGPALALELAKANLQESLERRLSEALGAEREAQLRCFASKDAREGIRAFLEKRKPFFRGE